MAKMIVNKETGAITFVHTKEEKEAIERKRKLKEDEERIAELKDELEEKLAKLDKILEKLEGNEGGGEE